METQNQNNKLKINNSDENYNQAKAMYKTDGCGNEEDMNENYSEKANSVHTSYQYRKNKDGHNSISSKDSYKNNNNKNYYKTQNEDEISIEISENDNLICPNCINYELLEDKKRREEIEREKYKKYENWDGSPYPSALYDRNRNYDRNLIEEKRRQREHNTNEAIKNLGKINEGMSSKDKLINRNENSRNPLNEGLPDYQYQKFQDEYARRQKMINENIDKFYPNSLNESPKVKKYYDNYIYNPKFNEKRGDGGYDGPHGEMGSNERGRNEYLRDLENQINYKNEIKRREKEEDRRRGQRQYEDMQKELKREEEERQEREKRQKEELIRANAELINQKNKLKIKELEEKLKYRELCEKQNEEFQNEMKRKQLEKERMNDDMYNHNKNELENRQKTKEKEKERERGMYYDINNRDKYDNRYDDKGRRYPDYDNINNKKYDNIHDRKDKNKIYDNKDNIYYDKYGDNNKGYDKYPGYDQFGNKIDDTYGKGDNRRMREDGKGKRKERMGKCCRCHKIFPRRLLSINRYFYKENRK